MSHELNEYFRSFNVFSEQEIEGIIDLVSKVTLQKDDFFIKEGQVCKNVAFVTSGMLRSFYRSSSDEEITYCFTFPNNFINAYSSFILQEKTSESIQALTLTELLVIPKQEIDRLEKSSRNWLLFSKRMAEQQFIRLEKRIFMLQKEKAEKRYEDLLEKNPEYLQLIPLNYLASYLGITQRHLSRIRKDASILDKCPSVS